MSVESAHAVASTGAAGAARSREHRFFTAMAIAAAVTVFLGFARSYYLRTAFSVPALSPLLHVHGLLFTGWIALFVAQTRLVATRRVALHRRLGLLGGVLVVAMVVAGIAAALDSARRGGGPPDIPPLQFLIIPLGDLAVFAMLAGAGLVWRRVSATHKRLMLLATVAILTPAIARMPIVSAAGPLGFFLLTDAFVVACWLHDRRTLGRVHPATLWGGLLIVLSQPVRVAASATSAWLAFAGWLTG